VKKTSMLKLTVHISALLTNSSQIHIQTPVRVKNTKFGPNKPYQVDYDPSRRLQEKGS